MYAPVAGTQKMLTKCWMSGWMNEWMNDIIHLILKPLFERISRCLASLMSGNSQKNLVVQCSQGSPEEQSGRLWETAIGTSGCVTTGTKNPSNLAGRARCEEINVCAQWIIAITSMFLVSHCHIEEGFLFA